MSTYTYFPGCSLTSTAIEYDTSFRLVARSFGIELDELADWNCCGASPAPHHLGGNLGVFLPARNLHIASRRRADMVAPCAGCYTRHKYAQHELERDPRLRHLVEETLGERVDYQTRILNIVEFFNEEIAVAAMAEKTGGRLAGIRLATYYGCVLTRPAHILQFDDPRNPVSMNVLLGASGAATPDFPFKTDCCGSYMGLVDKDIVLGASRRIIETAMETDMDAVVTACPLCHQNLDLRQRQINKAFGTKLHMPVLYFSQVLGLALGYNTEQLGIDAHAVGMESLAAKLSGSPHACETEPGRRTCSTTGNRS